MSCPYTQVIKDWLTEEGCYQAYLINLRDDDDGHKELHELTAHGRVDCLDDLKLIIGSSFVWSRTSEGEDFWADLEDEFDDYINSLKGKLPEQKKKKITLQIYKIKDIK